jgi:hypothetical protein
MLIRWHCTSGFCVWHDESWVASKKNVTPGEIEIGGLSENVKPTGAHDEQNVSEKA